MDLFGGLLSHISNFLYTYILIALLIFTGVYFTIRSKGVQFRLFPEALRVLGEKKKDGKDISSFQALMISTASRVGTGNIVGASGAILTGGPGTGKTTSLRGILSMYDAMGIETLLTAPTGRAAKRMSELTGREASTIHRLLGAGFSPEGEQVVFTHDEDDPLDCGAVILDECSMVDITLMRALLAALPELVQPGDCVLVKASHSMAFERIVQALTQN